MIPRIKSIKPLQGYLLHVIFDDGKDCIYDVNDDINTIDGYEDLKNIYGLFEQVQLDQSRTCVFWNDYIDLPSDTIYEYGTEREKIGAYLKAIAKSYDKGIELGRKGIDPYENLPQEITDHPDYALFQKMQKDDNLSDSGRKEILDYLLPKKGMKFVDLGCCLNLMFRGYGNWLSAYYGVDISSKTIDLLRDFVAKNDIKIGDLYCGSMDKTPYAENFFDIGACIGSLEYFERDFVEKVLVEAHRIIKPYGRFVLDIPNMGTPEFQITARIEEYLGRPDRFNMSTREFEVMLADYFKPQKKEEVGPMIQYFLVNLED